MPKAREDWPVSEDAVPDSTALYREIVARCGLPDLLATGTIHRALADVGADPATATRRHYRRALSRLEARMRAYLPPAELSRRIRLIDEFLLLG
ncbi:MAG TPA: hypothetical protein VFS43_29195 [Polyangiaceae bacterium]|nr:hypothetical protein [Polyangiaceae bacterium]